jgi:phosphohistidine phosphatase SixA
MKECALYSNGRVVTGCNHGEAFSKLSCAEQNGAIESGFYDEKTGKFFTEEYDFYVKQIFLIRHGEPQTNAPGADLTKIGILQVRNTAEFLSKNFDLAGFEAFTSPYLRCRHTADIIAEVTGLQFSVDCEVQERSNEDASQFLKRINATLATSPAKVVYVSHSDFIVNFTEQAIGHCIVNDHHVMPGGAITFIDAKRLVWCGKTCYNCEESKSKAL